VDPTKFPPRLLLDTGVFIRALEYDSDAHKNDPRTKDCRDLWIALSQTVKTEVLVAAVTVLEYMRGPSGKAARPVAPPVVPGVIYASFHYRVAIEMADWATTDAIREVRDGTSTPRRIVAYDALIVGTARAYNADCIVADDQDMKKLAAKAGIDCREPSHFRPDPTLFRGTKPMFPPKT
jgi:predicted nucleic acid-binding protein